MLQFPRNILLAAIGLLCWVGACSQTMTQNTFGTGDAALKYWLYTPNAADTASALLVYLHGGSGKGNDLNILLDNGFPKFLHDGDLGELGAYVVIPQVPAGGAGWGGLAAMVKNLVISVADSFSIDKTKISLTGHSMGGTGTWSVALRYPRLFARVAPLSGSVTLSDTNVTALSGSNVWAVVGSGDTIVDPSSSIAFINALNGFGNKSRITVMDGYTHFDVPDVYKDKALGLTEWLVNYGSEAGVADVVSGELPADANYYDLQGRVVSNPMRGCYIRRHRLVFVP